MVESNTLSQLSALLPLNGWNVQIEIVEREKLYYFLMTYVVLF